MFKHFFYFLLFLVSLNAQTGNSLKNPTTSVFDFTYNESTTVDINPKESIVEKVLIPISKEVALKRRISNIYNCGVDTYGNDYCPVSLAPADVFWDSLDGYTDEGIGEFVDYTNKLLSSTSATFNGSFTNRLTQVAYTIWTGNSNESRHYSRINNGALIKNEEVLGYLSKTPFPNSNRLTQVAYTIWTGNSNESRHYSRINNGALIKNEEVLGYLSKTPFPNSNRLTQVAYTIWTGNSNESRHYSRINNGALIKNEEVLGYLSNINQTLYSCTIGTLVGTTCQNSICPDGYTATIGAETVKGECKRTLEYTYYDYQCSSEENTQGYDYTPTSTGGDCNPKETTDLIDTDNDGIGDSCNSSIPPKDNCKREGYKCKNEFEYESFTNGTSESGVGSVTDYASKITTTITAESSISYSGQWVVTSIKYGNFYYEETQLKVGSSVGYPSGNINCNSVVVSACTPNQQTTVISSGNIGSVKGAGGNCRAGDGMGVFLSMQCVNVGSGITCPSGYVLKGSICEKTVENCPSGYIETTGTETSKGQCKGTVNYTYYNYKCSSDETVLNEGGNIQKVDTDNTSINTDILSSDLNSSTPPNGNCKKVIGVGKAAFVDGEWKCSPFMCNGDMKCGFGTCESGTKPSVDKYQDIAYSPIRADFDGSCNGVICDYVMNEKISYCEAEKCPEGDEYKVIMGECYKEECPEGTYLSGDKCLQVN